MKPLLVMDLIQPCQIKHCCEDMQYSVDFHCDVHDDFACGDKLILYVPKFDEYGIIIHDGGVSFIQINFCPFCGTKLPNSKRDNWFELMEKLGIDTDEDEIPEIYQNYGWWLK